MSGDDGDRRAPSEQDRLARDAEPTQADREALAQLILQLRASGINDRRVLGVIESIPRRLFLSARHHKLAYVDRALPIECGQTISQPAIVAMMTEALELDDTCRVLEIGTGSGYQTAVLCRLAAHVFSIERYRSLALLAGERLAALRIRNVSIRVGDGFEGWPEAAPFDRIILTAAAPHIPDALLAQLAPGGIVVAPIGGQDEAQTLRKLQSTPAGLVETDLAAVRFVPLLPGIAERL